MVNYIKMEIIPYLIRFLSGGLLVLGATLLAEKFKSPYLGGILLLFPFMTIATVYFVGKSIGNEAASKVVIGALLGIPIWLLYALALYFFLKQMSLYLAIFWSFMVWLLGASVFLYIKLHYL